MDNIRVFIGVDDARKLAAKILMFSIQQNTKQSVQFYYLDKKTISQIIDINVLPDMYTGFSFYRWAIPLLCGYKGKAIYLDADIINFQDINELWSTPMNECTHLMYKNFASVMLIDCEKAQWPFIDMVKKASNDEVFYRNIMWGENDSITSQNKGELCEYWNYLDEFKPEFDTNAKQVHYTVVENQPWVYLDHPYGNYFYDLVSKALTKNYINQTEIFKEIELGYWHPKIFGKLKVI